MKKTLLFLLLSLVLNACSDPVAGTDVIDDASTQDVVEVPGVEWCPPAEAVDSRTGALPRPVVEKTWDVGMVPATESTRSGLVAVDAQDETEMAIFESSLGLKRAHPALAGLSVYVHGDDEWAGVLESCAPAIPSSDEAYVIRWSVDDDGNQAVHIVAPSAAGRRMAWKTVRQVPGNLAGTELFIADAPSSARRGVIETFYGPVYEEADRLALLPVLAEMKFNVYLYAGKMDLYTDWVGTYWMDEWPADYMAMLGRLVDAAKSVGISPGVQIRIDEGSVVFSSSQDLSAFVGKVRMLKDTGFELFSLSFDDTARELKGDDVGAFESYDHAIIDFSRRAFEAIHAEMPDLKLGWVPTDYFSGSETAQATLTMAGEQIPPYVSIGWTGREVIPETISVADVEEVAEWIKRKPLLGDNYPVIDNAGARVFLGPLAGRAADLPGHLDGILFNPMPNPFASLPALATCADYAWNSAGYDPWSSMEAMARMLGGSSDGALALRVLARTNQSTFFFGSMAPELKAMIDEVWAVWDQGGTPDTTALAEVFAEFVALPGLWESAGPSEQIRAALQPWVTQLGVYGRVGGLAIGIINTLAAGQPLDSVTIQDFMTGFDEAMAVDRLPTGPVVRDFLEKVRGILESGPAFVWDAGCEGAGTGAAWTKISDSTFPRGPLIQMSDRDTVTILWRTAEPTDQEGCVDYSWGENSRTRCGVADQNGQYEVKLDRLPPGTEIQYKARVGDLSTTTLSFRTMPDRPVPMKFAMFADIHNNEEAMRRASDTILNEGVDFAVAVGDLTGQGLPEEFDVTFRGWQDLGSRMNIWSVPGNHDEKNIQGYFDAMAMPHGNQDETGFEEAWWSRRIGNVWMGGGWIRDFYLSPPEVEWGEVGWFKKQFESEEFKTAKWKLFFIHQPAYSVQWDDSCVFDGETCLKVTLIPLMSQYGLQASFHGHMHGIEWAELDGVNMFTIGGLTGTMDEEVCQPKEGFPEPWHSIYGTAPMAIVEAGCEELKVRIMDLDGNELAVVDVPEVPIRYKDPIKFMSFNLRLPFDSEPGKKWDERKGPIVDVIRDFAPDIMSIQEGYTQSMNHISENIENFAWIGDGRTGSFPDVDEYSAIFYRTDLFELIETKTLALSDTPETLGTMFDQQDQLYPRVVTWGHFRRLSDSFEFDVFSTHWDHTGVDGIREKMAVVTLEQMRELADGRPSVVAGDFNCGYQSVPYNIMTGAAEYEGVSGDLIDTWTELAMPEEGTYHAFTGVVTGDRIDWIMHDSGFSGLSADVIDTSFDGIYPSDHFPMAAEFLITKP